MEKELKPCPFCGSPDILINDDSYTMYAYCDWCGARGAEKPTKEKAAEAWNERTNDEQN